MSIKELLHLFGMVLKDFRVIGTVVAMFLIVSFAKYVTTYTRKPKKSKKKKQVVVAPAAPAPSTEEIPQSDFSEKDAD